jgi:hypothetical protein
LTTTIAQTVAQATATKLRQTEKTDVTQVLEYIEERLRMIEALKGGVIEPISRYELTVEEGVLSKILCLSREAINVPA